MAVPTFRRLLSATVFLAAAVSASAQTGPQPEPPPAPPPAATVLPETPDAPRTRGQLQQLLRQHPPSVSAVLTNDPSLLQSADYLEPYPALAAFLAQHPEVARNPSYFLGSFQFRERDPRELAYDALAGILGGLAALTAFGAFLTLLAWLVRAVIDHRRWLRLSRVQVEVHTKLMDRLTNNQDLLAYLQSPAGSRFLESAPITLDGEPRPAPAPLSRILWSLQAGIVLVALGGGFWLAQRSVMPEIAEGLYMLGVVAMSLGAGFAVSALAAFLLSNRLGLVPTPKA